MLRKNEEKHAVTIGREQPADSHREWQTTLKSNNWRILASFCKGNVVSTFIDADWDRQRETEVELDACSFSVVTGWVSKSGQTKYFFACAVQRSCWNIEYVQSRHSRVHTYVWIAKLLQVQLYKHIYDTEQDRVKFVSGVQLYENWLKTFNVQFLRSVYALWVGSPNKCVCLISNYTLARLDYISKFHDSKSARNKKYGNDTRNKAHRKTMRLYFIALWPDDIVEIWWNVVCIK